MITTSKLFGIVSTVAVFAALAFSLPAQAGIITRAQSPLLKKFTKTFRPPVLRSSRF